jgi:hypothetical protein
VDPDPQVIGPHGSVIICTDTDPAPDLDQDLSIIKQNRKKNLDFYCFVTSLL